MWGIISEGSEVLGVVAKRLVELMAPVAPAAFAMAFMALGALLARSPHALRRAIATVACWGIALPLTAFAIQQPAPTVASLDTRVTALERKTAAISIANGVQANSELIFTGVNVHVRNGLSETDGVVDQAVSPTPVVNGLGNLFIGYNEDFQRLGTRTGSHNLVVGMDNQYTSVGALVTGVSNRVSGRFGVAVGGKNNLASGDYSLVAAGTDNTSSGFCSSVTGGGDNTASGSRSSITGGSENTAVGVRSSVTGGDENGALADYSVVTGGYQNMTSGEYGSVTGGGRNNASGEYSAVSGGLYNSADSQFSSVSGGEENTAGGSEASISGGYRRVTTGTWDWSAGALYQNQ